MALIKKRTAGQKPVSDEVRYQNIVFVNAVIPVLKPIIEQTPRLTKAFATLNGVVQITALTGGVSEVSGRPGRRATHMIVEEGQIRMKLGEHPAPNLEIEFPNEAALNAFFLGGLRLPKLRGAAGNPKLLVATVRALLTMSSLLGSTEAPKDPATQALLVKSMFYLLTTGISQLNKAGHPKVKAWTSRQPDRAFELQVKGHPELGAYLRVKAAKSKAFRGQYTRAKPFFAMSFADLPSALGVLLGTADMLQFTRESKIEMLGAPEYGGELGDLMFLVGDYAKEKVQ